MAKKRRRQKIDDGGEQPQNKKQHFEELPEGAYHYEHISEVPSDTRQYVHHGTSYNKEDH
jgi:hypothetical protein